MSLYSDFKTDPQAERDGIVVDYGEYRVTVARAGGANKQFLKLMEARSRPYRRAINLEVMDNDLAMDILRECYAEAVVRNWETLVAGEWRSGIEPPDAVRDEHGKLHVDTELLPPTKENLVATFKALPDIFFDIKEQAEKLTLFRVALREEAGKNS